MPEEFDVFTIGHSRLSYENFVNLLMTIGVNMIVDVRSAPYSRQLPHFNRENLKRELEIDGIFYSFMGDTLGGRPKGSKFFCEGVADYEKMAAEEPFKRDVDRIVGAQGDYRIALLCSEHNPLDCHRCLLVGRALSAKQVSVGHIFSNGIVKGQIDIEKDLLSMSKRINGDIFQSYEERLAQAYRRRSMKVAYSNSAFHSSPDIELSDG